MKKKTKKSTNNYIDNEKFFKEMVKWKTRASKAENKGRKLPPVTDYIGMCFMDIAENLIRRPNFSNYPFRDDMVGDAIENCLMYCYNFDPEKSENPFSYFTQIIYYAFLRRIEKEKKQAYIKFKCMQRNDIDSKYTEWLRENNETASMSEFIQKNFYLSEHDIDKLEKESNKPSKKRKKEK